MRKGHGADGTALGNSIPRTVKIVISTSKLMGKTGAIRARHGSASAGT